MKKVNLNHREKQISMQIADIFGLKCNSLLIIIILLPHKNYKNELIAYNLKFIFRTNNISWLFESSLFVFFLEKKERERSEAKRREEK